MTSNATITFSQAGVQPPVYVVTSLSGWTTLELDVVKNSEASEDLVFTKEFANVAEGDYQYKIRIGEGYWVLDESKESATDEHGNRNNVLHVKAAPPAPTSPLASDDASKAEPISETSNHKARSGLADARKDSLADLSIPVPFVVVEKVVDKESPTYGDIESAKLPSDTAKRAADTEPDFETITPDPEVKQEPPKSPEIPLLVVERVDDKPAHGDDFGKDATPGQKVAHEIRAADASPDRLVVLPEPPVPTVKDDAAPLFKHESFQAIEPQSTFPLDEVSVQSSTDQTSSEDAINTPPEHDDLQSSNEFSHSPLLTHETGFGDEGSELRGGPLLSHEHGLYTNGDTASDDEDELGKAPLLSHESGFSDNNASENVTDSGYDEDSENMEPQHYGPYDDGDDDDFGVKIYERNQALTFPHEADMLDEDYDNAPLLPHEYVSSLASNAGSAISTDDRPLTLNGTDTTNGLFGGNVRPNVFRTRSTSSTLPHRLPLSDAEDENLNDPSLEQFPTSREQILERVASIGLQLPEDEPIEHHGHSPQFSVLSQACSSVDLVPVKSYTSLASVPEADYSDDEDDDLDVESLGSPGLSLPITSFSRNLHATPMSSNSKLLGAAETGPEIASSRSAITNETESVAKHDGTKDSASTLSTLCEAIATPSKVLNPITPPLTPEHKSINKETHPVATLDAELRERRKLNDDGTRDIDTTPASAISIQDKIAKAATPALAQQDNKRNETFLQNFIRIVFGSVGRLFIACAGDRKRASTSAVIIGIAVVAYLYAA